MVGASLLAAVQPIAANYCQPARNSGGASRRAHDPVSRNGAFSDAYLHSSDALLWPPLHDALSGRPSSGAAPFPVFQLARFSSNVGVDRISFLPRSIRDLVCDGLFPIGPRSEEHTSELQ